MEEYIKHYFVDKDGTITDLRTNKVRKKRLNKGYEVIDLFDGKGGRKTFSVHRLVAMKYLPNPNGLSQINHKNLIRNDNRVENLEWCDAKYNIRHARENGRDIYTEERNKKISKSKKGVPRSKKQKENCLNTGLGVKSRGRTTQCMVKNYPQRQSKNALILDITRTSALKAALTVEVSHNE